MEKAKLDMKFALTEWLTQKIKYEQLQFENRKMHSFNNSEIDFNPIDDPNNGEAEHNADDKNNADFTRIK